MAQDKEHKTKLIVRRLLQLMALTVMLLYFPIVMGFVADEQDKVMCTRVDSDIVSNDEDVLISSSELTRIVNRSFPDLSGMRINDINLNEIEVAIEKTPAVKKCECYSTPSGILRVQVTQRKPIMHVFSNGTSYYMDREGYKIAARTEIRAHALVVNGNVGPILDGDGLIELCRFINEDKFWKAQIEQIYVTDKQEYVLVPRVGDHVIEFGGIDRIEEKFDLLFKLYTNGWHQREWNLYKKVNVKYKGQVVCTKK
ncbi:MAG: hypothetical protein MJZ31_07800 [Bacteroidales bacterium]|nr:hypothetical protein [Bacteroidales bacterium]